MINDTLYNANQKTYHIYYGPSITHVFYYTNDIIDTLDI